MKLYHNNANNYLIQFLSDDSQVSIFPIQVKNLLKVTSKIRRILLLANNRAIAWSLHYRQRNKFCKQLVIATIGQHCNGYIGRYLSF